MTANAAPIIAAAALRARRRIAGGFREANAVSPPSAIAFEPRRRMERRYLAELIAFGAVVEARPGFYYLDEAKLQEHGSRRRRRALKLIGIALATGATVFGISRL